MDSTGWPMDSLVIRNNTSITYSTEKLSDTEDTVSMDRDIVRSTEIIGGDKVQQRHSTCVRGVTNHNPLSII